MMLQALFAFFVFLLGPIAALAPQPQVRVDVLIPKDMPIKIDVQRDISEPDILKYNFTRIVTKGSARQARITTVLLDNNGTITSQSSREGGELNDPMSLATADTSIARILIVVEWLETDKGKWVLDTKNQKVDIGSLIKHGAKALPPSKFISNDNRAVNKNKQRLINLPLNRLCSRNHLAFSTSSLLLAR